jgi:TRAP-type C4-dicarboxylate transport system permease small subunit
MNALARAWDALLGTLGLLAGALFALMALAIGVDVALRNLGGGGAGWLIEAIEYGLLTATLLAAPWVLREGAHVTVDVLVARLPGRWGSGARRLAALLGLAVCAAMAWYGGRATAAAMARDSLVFKSLVFPEWWILALVPAGMALMAVEFARQAWRGGAPPRPGRD